VRGIESIRHLEGRLGVRLFHRTTRRVSLTDEGSALYARASRWAAELDEIESAVRSDLPVQLIYPSRRYLQRRVLIDFIVQAIEDGLGDDYRTATVAKPLAVRLPAMLSQSYAACDGCSSTLRMCEACSRTSKSSMPSGRENR